MTNIDNNAAHIGVFVPTKPFYVGESGIISGATGLEIFYQQLNTGRYAIENAMNRPKLFAPLVTTGRDTAILQYDSPVDKLVLELAFDAALWERKPRITLPGKTDNIMHYQETEDANKVMRISVRTPKPFTAYQFDLFLADA
ncbi:MAG: hypothetical protein HY519_00735 [Candidatus Aenigmarchaeota archaeon]|nr:hypothetical protein [Candidatus Aenigmarchaeota archaeon]